MGGHETIEGITEASPRLKARIAGGLWLMVIFTARLTPFIVPAALLGKESLTLWLLVKGVNIERRKEQAGMRISF
jgi:hypothetical protein